MVKEVADDCSTQASSQIGHGAKANGQSTSDDASNSTPATGTAPFSVPAQLPLNRNDIALEGNSNVSASSVHIVSSKNGPSAARPACPQGFLSKTSLVQNRPWKTTFLRFGPLSGVFCMILAFVALTASLGVLAGSDGQAVAEWSAPPSTYLAIFVAIANLAVRYAAIQGVVITWWSRAAKGSTLARLHWDWYSGTTLRGALSSGRHFGLLGLACIASTIIVIDGPLIQRASTVINARPSQISLGVSMVPELPTGFTGNWATATQEGAPGLKYSAIWNETIPTNHGPISNYIWPAGTFPMAGTIGQWLASRPLHGVVHGCPSLAICNVKLRAPALWPTSCTNHLVQLNYNSSANISGIESELIAPPLEHDGFIIDVTLDVSGTKEKINTVTGFSTMDKECNSGVLNYTICSLESAIGEYDINIQGQYIQQESISSPKLAHLADNALVNHTWNEFRNGQPSTLAGVAYAVYTTWCTVASFYERGPSLGAELFGSDKFEEYLKPGDARCPSFKDPSQDVLRALNQLMFYFGNLASTKHSYADLRSKMKTDLPINYTTTGTMRQTHDVFYTNYYYFAAAATVEITCILLIFSTYWGWWRLGRPSSFSPLEIAKAFECPMLDNQNSNSSGRELAKATGNIHVQYGFMRPEGTGEGTKVAFGDPKLVDSPVKGMNIEGWNHATSSLSN